MEKLDREARRLQVAAFLLVALVTMGWMAGLGFGFGIAASDDVGFVHDTPAWLIPALQGLAALAISAVVVTLLGIIRRIGLRAHSMSEALPRLISQGKG